MIRMAKNQMKYSYAPYSGFKVGQSFLPTMESFTPDATLKMQLIPLRSAPSETQFSRLSAKDTESSVPSALPEGKTAWWRDIRHPAESADRS